jgi:hypothetical protein
MRFKVADGSASTKGLNEAPPILYESSRIGAERLAKGRPVLNKRNSHAVAKFNFRW